MPPPESGAKWSWRSPLTLARLTWLSVALGVASVIQGAVAVAPVVAILRGYGLPDNPNFVVAMGFALTVLLTAAALRARWIVKLQLQRFPRWPLLPAVTTDHGALAVTRYAGTCACGGKVRFYDKPVRWIDEIVNGRVGRRTVTEREMAAECERNPRKHWWEIDQAERPFEAAA